MDDAFHAGALIATSRRDAPRVPRCTGDVPVPGLVVRRGRRG